MISWWQHVPEMLDPVVLTVGSFSLRWYALFFLLGWGAAFLTLRFRVRKGEAPLNKDGLMDFFLLGFLGAVLGGRVGYALFYEPSLFLHPVGIISPFDASGAWTGIWGMSFHGALLGSVATVFLFSRSRGIGFWELSDFLVPAVPVALFFGRIGNFFNLELFGRRTESPWGMFFPDRDGSTVLRYPSQLYEAFFEGLVLFFVLFWARKHRASTGTLSLLFLALYSVFRFFLEFFREPDPGKAIFFDWMTTGQALSLGFFLISVVWMRFRFTGKYGMMKRKGE